MPPPAHEEDVLALPPGYVVNHLRITRVIGRGGFGITYHAEDIHTMTEVAVKELLPTAIATRAGDYSVVAQTSSMQPDFDWAIEAFIHEAATIARFKHPNLVRMLEFFEQNGTAYMVMPYLRGDHLKSVVAQRGPMGETQTLGILTALMGALELVHAGDILHRDIKPENIILEEHSHQPVLLDFGSSRNLVTARNQALTSIISAGYAPIEQYSTDAQYQGPWSDIYALAGVAYFLLSGTPPPESTDRSDASRHDHPDPCAPLHCRKDVSVSRPLSDAVMAGLRVSERDRPRSIAEWRKLLPGAQPAVPGPPPHHSANPGLPPPPTPPHSYVPAPTYVPPSRSAKKNNKKTAALLVLAGLVFTLLSVGGYVAYRHTSKKEKKTAKSGTYTLPGGGTPTVVPPTPAVPASREKTPDTPAGRTVSHEDVKAFVSRYYAAGQSGQQVDFYAYPVDNYFGTKSCSIEYVRKDNELYHSHWPNKKFTVTGAIEVNDQSGGSYHTVTRFGYQINNGVEFRSGLIKSDLIVRLVKGELKVTSAMNHNLRADPSTYDAEQQTAVAKEHVTRLIHAGSSRNGSILNQLNYYAPVVNPYFTTPNANHATIRNMLNTYAANNPTRDFRIIEALRVKHAGTARITVYATLSFSTIGRDNRRYRGNRFNTYGVIFLNGRPRVCSITSEAIE